MKPPEGVAIGDSAPYLLVPISGATDEYAIIDADGAEDLFREAPLPWWFNGNGYGQAYVKHRQPGVKGGLGRVARKVVGAGLGQIVRHANGDRLDLRRENLLVQRGRATGQTPALIKVEQEPSPASKWHLELPQQAAGA